MAPVRISIYISCTESNKYFKYLTNEILVMQHLCFYKIPIMLILWESLSP